MSDNFIFKCETDNPDGSEEVIIKHCDGSEYKIKGFIERENFYRHGCYCVLGRGESVTFKIVKKGFCEYSAEPEVLKR